MLNGQDGHQVVGCHHHLLSHLRQRARGSWIRQIGWVTWRAPGIWWKIHKQWWYGVSGLLVLDGRWRWCGMSVGCWLSCLCWSSEYQCLWVCRMWVVRYQFKASTVSADFTAVDAGECQLLKRCMSETCMWHHHTMHHMILVLSYILMTPYID